MAAIVSTESEHPPAGNGLCANCGEALFGKYCGACGEKRLDHHDLTMAHILGHAVHELTHFDSKIFDTLRLLIIHPGFLTRQYFAGRRTPYVAPLRIYLTMFAGSFFLYTFTHDLDIYDFGKILKAEPGTIKASLASVASRRSTTVDALVDAINHGWHHWISTLQFVTVVLTAIGLAIIYIRSRRHFVEHFVFTLHLVSFCLLTAIVTWPLWRVIGWDPRKLNIPLVVGSIAVDSIYCILAVRTFYGQRPIKSVIRGLLTFVIYYVSTVVVNAVALTIAVVGALRK